MAPLDSLPDDDKFRAFRGSREERLALARRDGLAPELLVLLAADELPEVRCAVAENESAPGHADRVLAQDRDPEVRAALARKLGRRAAELEGSETAERKSQRLAAEALRLLLKDQVDTVREALADTLADMPEAPLDLILALAFDVVPEVCEPVIRLSRVLEEAHLLSLVRQPPGPGSRLAVARRLHLAAALAQAVVETSDLQAIVALLRNPTARIAAQTLADLVSLAEREEAVQEPMAARGAGLPPDLLARLAAAMTEASLARALGNSELPDALRGVLQGRAGKPAKPARKLWAGD
jgi:uncharacterized protein (DUF2336 family)